MQKMTSTVRDTRAKIERKVKKWRFNRIFELFECYYYHIQHTDFIIISLMSSNLQKRQYLNLKILFD